MTKKETAIFRNMYDDALDEYMKYVMAHENAPADVLERALVLTQLNKLFFQRIVWNKGPSPFPFNAAPLIGGRFPARETQRKGYYVQAVVVGALETVIVGFRQKYCPPRLM